MVTAVQRVNLHFAPQVGWACLRELTGSDELAVMGTGAADAIRLVDGALVADSGGALEPGGASRLTASDRDRLLAAIYIDTYGSRIAGALSCRDCGKLFDTDFSLNALVAHLWQKEEGPSGELKDLDVENRGDGFFEIPDGTVFRLPTGEDESAVAGLPPEEAARELLTACLSDKGANGDLDQGRHEAVQAAMAALAPILDLDLEARCWACGEPQSVHFDLQHYLLSALLQERDWLMQEIHRVAGAYGWRLEEILSLPRSRRRMLAALIEAERTVGRRELI